MSHHSWTGMNATGTQARVCQMDQGTWLLHRLGCRLDNVPLAGTPHPPCLPTMGRPPRCDWLGCLQSGAEEALCFRHLGVCVAQPLR